MVNVYKCVVLYRDGEYVFGQLAPNNAYFSRLSLYEDFCSVDKYLCNIPESPLTITPEFIDAIEIPNIGFIEEEWKYRIYDKSENTFIEVELPIYIKYFDTYRDTGKKTTIKLPSKKAIMASYKMLATLKNYVAWNGLYITAKLNCLKEKKQVDEIYKFLELGRGITYIDTYKYRIWSDLITREKGDIYSVYNYHQHLIIVSKERIVDDILDLHVPKEIIPFVIGKGGARIKSIAKQIGVKHINVISIE